MKLFVGGLAWTTDNNGLRAAFEAYGKISDAVVVQDRETGRSRGFGFVTFDNDEEGRAAMKAMEGATLDGRTIRCSEAQQREGRPGPAGARGRDGGGPPRGRGGSGGGGGGGFGGPRGAGRF